MTIYKWKQGSRVKASPQVAGEVCAALDLDGNLTPGELVRVSRPKDAPLHGEFEWNDAIAAEKYREEQARYIIRSIEVVYDTEESKTVRAFVPTYVTESSNTYRDVHAVLANDATRGNLLDAALKELQAFKHKYHALLELAEVFDAVDKLEAA